MYWWLILFLPAACFILFVLPLRFAFLLKGLALRILIPFAVFVAEYFFYTYMASQLDLYNGLYNGLLSILFFVVFFYRSIGNNTNFKARIV
jgi:hypothetical protein